MFLSSKNTTNNIIFWNHCYPLTNSRRLFYNFICSTLFFCINDTEYRREKTTIKYHYNKVVITVKQKKGLNQFNYSAKTFFVVFVIYNSYSVFVTPNEISQSSRFENIIQRTHPKRQTGSFVSIYFSLHRI